MKTYTPSTHPVMRTLYWVVYLLILLNVFLIDWTLTSKLARAEEPARVLFLDTAMERDEFMAHMDGYFEQVVDAIYLAEGGARAKKPFGILSVPCSDYGDCRKIAKNTVRNNYVRWIKAGRPGDYIAFLGGKYAPVGVKNDPRGLNAHWIKNVNAILNNNLS